MANVTYIVKLGDNLTKIANKYNTTVKNLVKLNNITDPDFIVEGQKLTVSGSVSSSSASSSSSSKAPIIKAFGLQSNANNTLYATWSWSKTGDTESYKVRWEYDTGNGVWFIGEDGNVEYLQDTYSIPSNAKKVRFKVKPIAKPKSEKNKNKRFTEVWSNTKIFNVNTIPPAAPSAPSLSIENRKITARLDNIDTDITHIQFRVYKNDTTLFKTSGNIKVNTRSVSYSCTVAVGGTYKVRCRAYKEKTKDYSDWSDYSSVVTAPPAAPGKIVAIKALSETSVQLDWENVSNATTYEIQYTTAKMYFDSSDEVQTKTVDATVAGHAEITGMETGKEWFFRVRACIGEMKSTWCPIVSIRLGAAPIAPTTWSSTTTSIVGEPLNLYWIHNSEDGSTQTYAQLKLTINGESRTYTMTGSGVYAISSTGVITTVEQYNEDDKNNTNYCIVDTTLVPEGAEIVWSVRTAGITREYGDWATARTINIYSTPTLTLNMAKYPSIDADRIEVLNSFPFYILGLAEPNTQTPTGYNITIIANESYETVDNIGNVKMVKKDDVVYSEFFDISRALTIILLPDRVDLENGISYTVVGTVSMDSGLTAEASLDFTVAWEDELYEPNAEISINKDSLTALIRPYCEYYPLKYYKVDYDSSTGVYSRTTEEIDKLEGLSVENAYTTDDDIVYLSEDSNVYFCVLESKEGVLVDDVSLSVYRREFDGSFTEIETGIDHKLNTWVPDPHPSLDYARYRIVATSNITGAVSYSDIPGELVGEDAAVIQWDDDWVSFDTAEDAELVEPAWTGSLLKLPYNLDVSDSHASDVTLIEYAGRKHPVSYYGTQLGETATWNMEIPKDDIDTLYALRRLAVWMGDVYVREPSGSGYWANISVSFSQKHCELTIPITLDVKRVEGGK